MSRDIRTGAGKPASHEADSLPVGGHGSPASARPASHVLIVEDHADSADMLETLLTSEGHTVGVARSVAEATAPGTGPWDVVISDLGLPDGNGRRVAEHYNRLAPRPRLVIALSGHGSPDDVRASMAAGFDLHLTKPLDFDRLRALLTARG